MKAPNSSGSASGAIVVPRFPLNQRVSRQRIFSAAHACHHFRKDLSRGARGDAERKPQQGTAARDEGGAADSRWCKTHPQLSFSARRASVGRTIRSSSARRACECWAFSPPRNAIPIWKILPVRQRVFAHATGVTVGEEVVVRKDRRRAPARKTSERSVPLVGFAGGDGHAPHLRNKCVDEGVSRPCPQACRSPGNQA